LLNPWIKEKQIPFRGHCPTKIGKYLLGYNPVKMDAGDLSEIKY